MAVEKDYTKEFPKFRVDKLCGGRDIHMQKWMISNGQIYYFYILKIFRRHCWRCSYLEVYLRFTVFKKRYDCYKQIDCQ